MDSNQLKGFASDLQSAIAQVMAKHGISMAKVGVGADGSGNMVIKISQPKVTAATGASQPTPNAITRYKQLGGKLGLPTLNAMLMVDGKEYALVGLSSDGSRVKARLTTPGAAVIDLPLGAVLAAIASHGAKQVAALDKAEAAALDDVVDQSVISQLAAIAAKAAIKPAEGQK